VLERERSVARDSRARWERLKKPRALLINNGFAVAKLPGSWLAAPNFAFFSTTLH
jgi:hypothetical protein